ncbi:hypothetical protein EVAR_69997_1 [Eumeta japonica]|uniref:Uncharacterized protein n=1 Tax=Eumeta variegata TaxID=151549 RepID=A0A4C2A6U3_EUMVA|nr:hypothetical protein EVAR_69997_1 [Eumeta japonica]
MNRATASPGNAVSRGLAAARALSCEKCVRDLIYERTTWMRPFELRFMHLFVCANATTNEFSPFETTRSGSQSMHLSCIITLLPARSAVVSALNANKTSPPSAHPPPHDDPRRFVSVSNLNDPIQACSSDAANSLFVPMVAISDLHIISPFSSLSQHINTTQAQLVLSRQCALSASKPAAVTADHEPDPSQKQHRSSGAAFRPSIRVLFK